MSSSSKRKQRFLIGLTGSVACIKLPNLIQKISERIANYDICLIGTENSLHFVDIHSFNQIESLRDRLSYIRDGAQDEDTNRVLAFSDKDEWSSWSKRNDPVLHIDLRKWADLYLIAPLDANTLAKLSNGQCDNLVTCVARAWDFSKPIVICPAMNTFMYEHKLTRKQLNMLVNDLGYVEIKAVQKLLMCGDFGSGALAEVDDIISVLIKLTTT
jgi:phosphopantothenoylcysteine decarboxylase